MDNAAEQGGPAGGGTVPADAVPVDAVRRLLDAAGITRRRLSTVVALLTEGPRTVAALVGESAVERRTVEAVVAALGDDIEAVEGNRMRIVVARVPTYRDLIGYGRLRATAAADPFADLLARHAPLVARLDGLISGAPRPRRHLDHVPATAETAVRRALWLDSTYDLDGARLLCVGDHDLTSLAVAVVNPRVEVTVVDVDEGILAYIDGQRLPSVRCLWSDLRFGLADGARGWADLVFTDPPYTPEGVGLFLGRGLEGLRDRDNPRLVMAYGFAAGHPGLGLKVQQTVAGMRLVYEAVLPGFNRYHGAQAVGGASDLYVLRPTAGSWRSAGRTGVNIYTHGSQSLEATDQGQDEQVMAELDRAAAGPDGLPVVSFGGAGLPLDGVFTGDLGRHGRAVAADLRDDPGSWLARVLLAVDVPRLAVLVPNHHPDLADEAGQRALTELLRTKYVLRLRRSTPGPHLAIVEADRIDPAGLKAADRAVRAVLDRAYGKVTNTWRESLIRAGDGTLTKNEARALIRAADPAAPDERLIDLPRHRIAELLRSIARSAGPGASGQT